MNANKEIFPLAYSVVDSENSNSWSWFLHLLATTFFANGESICIISDRHRGIDATFNNLPELQHVHRRCCLRHLRSNVMTQFRNKRLKSLVWEASSSVKQRDFDLAMKTIQEIFPDAYQYLGEIPPKYWALSHDGGHRFGILTTNSSESFNNTLKGCRMLPVTAIARLTFHKLVAMFQNRRSAGEIMQQARLRWPTNINKQMSDRERFKYNASIRAYNNQRGIYEVALESTSSSLGQPRYVKVNLTDWTCSCGRWAVDGLPCAHVISACHYRGTVPDSFVPKVFSLEYYIGSYAEDLNPLPDDEVQLTTMVTCLPPFGARRKAHRGQQRRSRFPNEMDFGSHRR
ncbi:uncharacterized protein LOC116025463 [Ipomoea triloba]|uniref:uncharacterized protein LOC116025463 n=1 Tax=Ipomoea triloba TaxID=35885 RepID=UPI00125D796D|nr:uncharacterized protein LOC116025463 [Ipomoea triloba]